MKLRTCKTAYAIDMSEDEAKKLFFDERGRLYARLEEIEEIQSINYDGHFGPSVYYDVEITIDLPSVHDDVIEVIEQTLKEINEE